MVQDNSDDETKSKTTREETKNMAVEDRIIKAIIGIGGKPLIDTLVYAGCLNPEELIDWIREMENFFEFW